MTAAVVISEAFAKFLATTTVAALAVAFDILAVTVPIPLPLLEHCHLFQGLVAAPNPLSLPLLLLGRQQLLRAWVRETPAIRALPYIIDACNLVSNFHPCVYIFSTLTIERS